jgi:hypothetical protein
MEVLHVGLTVLLRGSVVIRGVVPPVEKVAVCSTRSFHARELTLRIGDQYTIYQAQLTHSPTTVRLIAMGMLSV